MKYVKLLGKILLALVVFFLLHISYLFLLFVRQTIRDSALDQAVLPYAEIKGNDLYVYNIQDFSYTNTQKYTPGYYDATFNLDKIKNVYFVVEPFPGYAGATHTFLSFEFENKRFISIFVEIRKEKGESFSLTKGALRQYKLTYIIAGERDVIKLRSNYRKDNVFVYLIKTTPEKMRAVFIDMIDKTNKLKAEPGSYNTLTNTTALLISQNMLIKFRQNTCHGISPFFSLKMPINMLTMLD